MVELAPAGSCALMLKQASAVALASMAAVAAPRFAAQLSRTARSAPKLSPEACCLFTASHADSNAVESPGG